MVDELVRRIYETTVKMADALKENEFDQLNELLNERSVLMEQLDGLKAKDTKLEYSPELRKLLEEALRLDQQIKPKLSEEMTQTQLLLNQEKQKRQVSEKYTPYFQQMHGAFLDTKK